MHPLIYTNNYSGHLYFILQYFIVLDYRNNNFEIMIYDLRVFQT